MPTIFKKGNEELRQLATDRTLDRLLDYFNARISEWPHIGISMECFTIGVFYDLGERFRNGDAFDLLNIAAEIPLSELSDRHFLLVVELIAELARSSDTTQCPPALQRELPMIKSRVESLDPSYIAWDVVSRQYALRS